MDGDLMKRPPCKNVEEALQRMANLLSSQRNCRFTRERLDAGAAVRFTISVKPQKGGGYSAYLNCQVVDQTIDLTHYSGVA